jgi:hypothetical protein
LHIQAGQCNNQMGAKFWVVACDEHGTSGDGATASTAAAMTRSSAASKSFTTRPRAAYTCPLGCDSRTRVIYAPKATNSLHA